MLPATRFIACSWASEILIHPFEQPYCLLAFLLPWYIWYWTNLVGNLPL